MHLDKVPFFLEEYVRDSRFVVVTEGMSGAKVWRVEQNGLPLYYLKAGSQVVGTEIRAEAERLAWIGDRFPAPQVIVFGEEAETAYLLTAALKGVLLQDVLSHHQSLTIVKQVGHLLRDLHRIPSGDCPFDMRLQQRLAFVRSRIEHGLVDANDFDEERQGVDVFVLWEELLEKRPVVEDIVVTYGDFTPANILVNPETLDVAGVIDWGKAGVADCYQDIALMLRELEPSFQTAFIEGYGDGQLLDKERIHYYQLLDEFF